MLRATNNPFLWMRRMGRVAGGGFSESEMSSFRQAALWRSVKVKIYVNVWQKSYKSRTRLHLDFFPILKHLPD